MENLTLQKIGLCPIPSRADANFSTNLKFEAEAIEPPFCPHSAPKLQMGLWPLPDASARARLIVAGRLGADRVGMVGAKQGNSRVPPRGSKLRMATVRPRPPGHREGGASTLGAVSAETKWCSYRSAQGLQQQNQRFWVRGEAPKGISRNDVIERAAVGDSKKSGRQRRRDRRRKGIQGASATPLWGPSDG